MSIRKTAMILFRILQLAFLAMVLAELLVPGYPIAWAWAFLPLLLSVVIGLAVSRSGPGREAADRPPVEVEPPVRGRWSAMNSPATKVPSHGTHAYGQTYAIDIVAEPIESGKSRPAFAKPWPVVRRNRAFPAYDEPLFAVADATVVHASDWMRDHLSRNSLPALAYLMLIEGAVREISGARWIVGNHVVLDLGDGVYAMYAMYAHVRRGSLRIKPGDRVRAGQQIARCGNSGNSTEPHVHFQLMDSPDLDAARGIPFTWSEIGVPANKETFTTTSQRGAGNGATSHGEPAGEVPPPSGAHSA
ncbi:M23 family metallopeptidase [Streptomyces sp. ActVer]|uniref:M23 family metallopeptidase n=1 Tax=Streptomyces sp. ActVer TaxID=3014558 RepID=UPI0022B51AAA|nr:M23 family metallopeptidase [Streptomyces sp. ActVer]MCZ4510367.1 M23 family metallopeptidase [Streptomyces sp. ActVer]